MPDARKPTSPFHVPLSLRNGEELLFERSIDVCHETVRLLWNRFSPLARCFLKRTLRRHCLPAAITTDGLRSSRALR